MTSFEYACFISYRNSRKREDGLLSVFAKQLSDALERTLDTHLYEDIARQDNDYMVFLDDNIIETGDFMAKTMGDALCKSICSIVLFTRNYLGGSFWCASELHGMLKVERHRLDTMQVKPAEMGFILPILFKRDIKDMPKALRQRAFEKDFTKFTLAVKDITEHEEFVEIIEALAEKIAAIQAAILEKNTDICGHCMDFSLHDVETDEGRSEIIQFVADLRRDQYTPEQPFS